MEVRAADNAGNMPVVVTDTTVFSNLLRTRGENDARYRRDYDVGYGWIL
jgi:hypothetical protein